MYLVNTSLTNSKKVAIGASLGIALSNGFYIMLCLFGYATIFSKSEVLMTIIKVVGGGYMLYLGVIILKAKVISMQKNANNFHNSTFLKEVIRGFYLSFLNPKISIFYISLFALAINKETPLHVQLIYGVWMFLLVFLWDSMLVMLLNKKTLKEKILSFSGIEKIMGFLLIIIGGGLFYSLL